MPWTHQASNRILILHHFLLWVEWKHFMMRMVECVMPDHESWIWVFSLCCCQTGVVLNVWWRERERDVFVRCLGTLRAAALWPERADNMFQQYEHDEDTAPALLLTVSRSRGSITRSTDCLPAVDTGQGWVRRGQNTREYFLSLSTSQLNPMIIALFATIINHWKQDIFNQLLMQMSLFNSLVKMNKQLMSSSHCFVT